MFFLLRAAFWMTVVVLLLPGDPKTGADAPRVGVVEAFVAARSAVADFSAFCERNPETCATGSTAMQVFVAKVKYGAEVVSSALHRPDAGTGQGTLSRDDLEPMWHQPAAKDKAA
jgi:hypothetical protein